METWVMALEIVIFAIGWAVVVICAYALMSIAATVISIVRNLRGK